MLIFNSWEKLFLETNNNYISSNQTIFQASKQFPVEFLGKLNFNVRVVVFVSYCDADEQRTFSSDCGTGHITGLNVRTFIGMKKY